jgi:EcsC family protein
VETVEPQTREARDVPRWLWDRLRADPVRAPEHIALAAADVHGPPAARWVAERQAARQRAPGTHARDAVRRHVHLARAAGAATGLGGWTTMALDLASLAWIQSRMVFFVAASYGWDPRDPMRPAELLVLQGVYDDPYEARAALDGTGKTVAEAYVGNLADRDRGLVGRLARLVGGHAGTRLGGKMIPGFASILNSVTNGRDTKALGRRAIEFYGGRTA